MVLRYATNLWKPVPDREIWGGFSIKNGINREKVVNFSDIKNPNLLEINMLGFIFCARDEIRTFENQGFNLNPENPGKTAVCNIWLGIDAIA